MTDTLPHYVELLIFSLGTKETYAVDVSIVQEIFLTPPITKIPKATECIAGAIHFRGAVVSVIFLDKMLHISNSIKSDKLVMVTKLNGSEYAFLVNSVDKIVRISPDDIKQTDSIITQESYVSGYVQTKEIPIIQILDLENLIKMYRSRLLQ